MTRRLWISGTLLALAGCATTSQVLETFPSPIVFTRPPIPVPPSLPVPRPPQPQVAQPKSRNLAGATIVIDPGHGGDDDGAFHHPRVRRNTRVPEKTIVLTIAQQVRRHLADRGAKVVMTRDSNRSVGLAERAAMADRTRADLFVSIHADSAKRASASGTTVHIYKSPKAASRHAATSIDTALRRAGIKSRGIRKSNLHVLREHARPAVLIECGYLSNAGDAQRLNQSGYQAKIAAAIADGIANHFSH